MARLVKGARRGSNGTVASAAENSFVERVLGTIHKAYCFEGAGAEEEAMADELVSRFVLFVLLFFCPIYRPID